MKSVALAALVCTASVLSGCHTDLWVQPKTRTMEPNSVFPNGPPLPPTGTVASGPHFENNTASFPTEETAKALHVNGLVGILARGRERFDIFCSPCHGRLGDGEGMIARRGLALTRQPRNLHIERLQLATDPYLYSVVTHGYGAMALTTTASRPPTGGRSSPTSAHSN